MKNKLKIVIAVFAMMFIVTGCGLGAKDDSSKYNIKINAPEKLDVKTYISAGEEDLIVLIKNNNDYDIGSFDIVVDYYDKNGNKIDGDDTMSLDFKSGTELVKDFELPHNDDYEYYVPDRVEVKVIIDEEYQQQVKRETLYNDKIEVTYQKQSDEIQLTVKNNSNVDYLTVEGAVLFMKNGKIVAIEEFNGSFDAYESDSDSIDIPEYWDEKKDDDVLIDYDDIKIVINRASN